MKNLVVVLFVVSQVVVQFTPFTQFQAQAQDDNIQLGMYVVVSDLQRAKLFYSELFQEPVAVENENFAGLIVSGGLFGLFKQAAFTHEFRRGNNAVPYLRVENIESAWARMQELGVDIVHEEIVREGIISLFMFLDPDGNAIEFYALNQ